MVRGYFITGTDTGVGKTLIAGALAAGLRRHGKRVGVMKPCETGCAVQNGRLVPSDALFLTSMAGSEEPLEVVCPYRLATPVAPLVAAEREAVHIDIDRIVRLFHEIQHQYDIVLVEGAGGLLVPLTTTVMNLDLALLLGLPLVVVARLSLGTINHTLLTEHAARSRGAVIAGIVINQLMPDWSVAEQTNPEVLRRFSQCQVIGPLPYLLEQQRSDPKALADLADTHLIATLFS